MNDTPEPREAGPLAAVLGAPVIPTLVCAGMAGLGVWQLIDARYLLAINYLVIALIWFCDSRLGRLRVRLGYHRGRASAFEETDRMMSRLGQLTLPTSLRGPEDPAVRESPPQE